MSNIWKKIFSAGAVAALLFSVGCGKEEAKEEDPREIELSVSKLTITEGEDSEIEIENYDDLEKVKVEIEDEDIAEADLDDEIITISGVSAGKTTLTVSAKDCEDVTLTVRVEEAESAGPDLPPEPNGGVTGGGEVPANAQIGITGEYVAEYPLTPEFMARAISPEDESEQEMILAAFASLDLSMRFYLNLMDTNTATLTFAGTEFKDDFSAWLDEHYMEFMGAILAGSGESMTADIEEQLLAMKPVMMEQMTEEMSSGIRGDESFDDLTWELDGDKLTISGPNVTREAEIRPDGSFMLEFTAEELGNDAEVFLEDSDTLVLVFHRN